MTPRPPAPKRRCPLCVEEYQGSCSMCATCGSELVEELVVRPDRPPHWPWTWSANPDDALTAGEQLRCLAAWLVLGLLLDGWAHNSQAPETASRPGTRSSTRGRGIPCEAIYCG